MSFQSATKPSPSAGSKRLFPQPGDTAPDCTLTATDGTSVTLSSFWAVKPTILVFLRHFGCPFCREQVALLRQDYAKIQTAGAEVVCIGQGPYKAGKAFSILMDLAFPVIVCGDDFSVYEQYGLGKGSTRQLIGVNVIKRGFTAIRHGIGLGPVEGDPAQMPGAFVIDLDGKVLLAHRNADQADNISVKELMQVLAK